MLSDSMPTPVPAHLTEHLWAIPMGYGWPPPPHFIACIPLWLQNWTLVYVLTCCPANLTPPTLLGWVAVAMTTDL